MGSRRRKRSHSPDVLAGGLRTFARGLPVALFVVGVFMAPAIAMLEHGNQSWVEVKKPGDLAMLSFTNTAAATWFGADVLVEVPPRRGALLLAGVLGLALCYAATGVVAALLYDRFARGYWGGTTPAAIGRLGFLGILVALVFGWAKAFFGTLLEGVGHGFFPAVVGLMGVMALELWLYARHSLALPILAIERVSLASALRRSRRLTRRAGAGIAGILLLFGLVQYVLVVVQAQFGLLDPLRFACSLVPLAALSTAFQGALLATAYRNLREFHEGPEAQEVARVFE